MSTNTAGPYGAYDIRNKVDPNSDCLILEPLSGTGSNVNDSVSPPPNTFTVNVNGFFGADVNDEDTLWLFDGKYDNIGSSSGTDGSSYFNFTGNNQSGTFSYTGSQTLPYTGFEFMFVFKDGGDTNLVAYLIDMQKLLTPVANGGKDNIGTYSSPFVEPPFTFPGNGPRAISHISVYYRQGDDVPPEQVPEPATLGLLGLGMLAMGALRRRKVALKR